MLKRRVIVSMTFVDGVLFRTKQFVPDYRYTQSYLATGAVDEVFLLDVTRSGPSEGSLASLGAYAERCFAPVTMGGWVDSLSLVRELFALGADKVVIGRSAIENPVFIREIAEKYGSQAVVVACDVENGRLRGDKRGLTPIEWCVEAQSYGAGEIFFQSIDRDGSLLGYDLALLGEIVSAVTIPVVVGGGCGGWRHMAEAFRLGAGGCSTSVIHHFTETSLSGFKKELGRVGIPVREDA